MFEVGKVSYSWNDKKVNEEILAKAMQGVNALSEIILGEAKKLAGINRSPVTNTGTMQRSGFIRKSLDNDKVIEIIFDTPYARKQHEGGVTKFKKAIPFLKVGGLGQGLVFIGTSNPDRQKWIDAYPDAEWIWTTNIVHRPKKFLEIPFNNLKGELKSFIEREINR